MRSLLKIYYEVECVTGEPLSSMAFLRMSFQDSGVIPKVPLGASSLLPSCIHNAKFWLYSVNGNSKCTIYKKVVSLPPGTVVFSRHSLQ